MNFFQKMKGLGLNIHYESIPNHTRALHLQPEDIEDWMMTTKEDLVDTEEDVGVEEVEIMTHNAMEVTLI